MNCDSEAGSADDALEPIVETFLEQLRRGERPSIESCVARHPEFAVQIRELLPAVVEIEGLGSIAAAPAPEPRVLTPSPRLPFERLGDYRILGYVGEGGMGAVYEAERESLRCRVALKVMHDRYRADSTYLRRFHLEARAAASLHHTNIVSVFDFGEHQGVCYYAMQFIVGEGLDRVLDDVRRLRGSLGSPGEEQLASTQGADPGVPAAGGIALGMVTGRFVAESPDATDGETPVPTPAGAADCPLTVGGPMDEGRPESGGLSVSLSGHTETRYVREVARLGAQVADALAYAHKRGVLHRDIKPSNILLDAAGNAWITDFGLAKFEDGDDLSRSRDLVGTLRYMAPERFHGVSDKRGDVYALGATLYEMLTLQTAFGGSDQLRLIQSISYEAPQPLRKLDHRIPRDLETIVLKAMAKDPRDRFTAAEKMAEELRRFVEGRPIESRPIRVLERLYRWARRNPIVAGLNLLAAALTITIAIVSTIAADRNGRLAKELKEQRDAARSAEHTALDARDAAQAAARRAEAAEKSHYRELYRAYLAQARATRESGRAGQKLQTLATVRDILEAVPREELSAARMAELRDEVIAALALPDAREVERRPGLSSAFYDVDWNERLGLYCFPDHGRRCTVIRRGFDPTTDVSLPPFPPDDPLKNDSRRFSPNGRWLAEVLVSMTDYTRNRLRVWEWESRRLAFDERVPIPGTDFLAFHPTAPEIIASGLHGALIRIDLIAGKSRVASSRPVSGSPLAFAPDGESLLLSNGELGPQVVEAHSLGLIELVPGVASPGGVAWSPDGRTLALSTVFGEVYLWDRRGRVGRFLPERHDGGVVTVRFSSDGEVLATSGGDDVTRLWAWRTDQPLPSLPGRVIGFSADGRRMAAVDDREFVLYELAPRAEKRSIRGPADGAEFSPDGSLLVVSGPGGVRIHATDTLDLIGDLRMDHCGPIAFRPGGRELVTAGQFTRWWRWPIRRAEGSDSIALGAPEPVEPGTTTEDLLPARPGRPLHTGRHAAWNRDGRVLAVIEGRTKTVQLADPEGRARPRVLGRDISAERVAVSPDGQWIAAATGAWCGARVWRSDGTPADLDLPTCGAVAFSPDGQWFATASRFEVAVYRVGTWERVQAFPRDQVDADTTGPLAFQPVGGLLAAAVSRRQVRLYEPKTGQVVASLTHPEPCPASWLSFSSDGMRLAVTRFPLEVAVWDLGGLRSGLSALGLDADRLPVASQCPASPSPKVHVDRGRIPDAATLIVSSWRAIAGRESARGNPIVAVHDATSALNACPTADRTLRARILVERGQYHRRAGLATNARDDFQAALALDPESTEAAIWLARASLFGPPEVHDIRRAIGAIAPVATRADAPRSAHLYLGVAQVRLGNDQEGLACLDRVTGENCVRDGFRAIALFRLGKNDAAHKVLKSAKAAEKALKVANPDITALEECRQACLEAEAALSPPAR